MKQFYFLLIICILFGSCHKISFRKTLKVPSSESIEESKQRGLYICEYCADSCIIYDSIVVRVNEAFVEHFCKYKDYGTDSLWISATQQIVINFCNNEWPGYYTDTSKCINKNTYNNWIIDHDVSLLKKRHISFFPSSGNNGAIAPDTLSLYITEVELLKDSIKNYNLGPAFNPPKRQDTIGCIKLIRKKI